MSHNQSETLFFLMTVIEGQNMLETSPHIEFSIILNQAPQKGSSGLIDINAFFKSSIIGSISGHLGSDDSKGGEGGTAVINMFFVNKNFRGKGVGTSLVDNFITYAREHGGCDKIIF